MLQWNRLGMAPGFCAPWGFKAPICRRLCYGSNGHADRVEVVDLHRALLRRTNHTGSDIRISSGTIMNPKAFPRQSVNSAWWTWKKVFATKWQKSDHINSLELRALVHSVDWRVFHRLEFSCRIFHLVDSYIVMAIVSKGRTSSAMLRPLLRKLAATLLACDLYLIVGHVGSLDNPTEPSIGAGLAVPPELRGESRGKTSCLLMLGLLTLL